jgi:hypothetical protein
MVDDSVNLVGDADGAYVELSESTPWHKAATLRLEGLGDPDAAGERGEAFRDALNEATSLRRICSSSWKIR